MRISSLNDPLLRFGSVHLLDFLEKSFANFAIFSWKKSPNFELAQDPKEHNEVSKGLFLIIKNLLNVPKKLKDIKLSPRVFLALYFFAFLITFVFTGMSLFGFLSCFPSGNELLVWFFQDSTTFSKLFFPPITSYSDGVCDWPVPCFFADWTTKVPLFEQKSAITELITKEPSFLREWYSHCLNFSKENVCRSTLILS